VGRVRSLKQKVNASGIQLSKCVEALRHGPADDFQAHFNAREGGHIPKVTQQLAGGVRIMRHTQISNEKAQAALKLLRADHALAAAKKAANAGRE
jgi:hypothetical protein